MTKNLIFFIIISLSNAYNIKRQNGTPTPNQIYINYHIDMSMGDALKGERIFIKKISPYCNITNDKFALIHTQDEWEDIAQAGKFKDEVFKICPKIEKIYKDRWSAHLYQFVYEYASDSGNIPLSY